MPPSRYYDIVKLFGGNGYGANPSLGGTTRNHLKEWLRN
jgi:hypothetical protein